MSGLYCVLDRVAERFAPPFVAVNDGIALRYFNRDVLSKVDPSIAGDYALYKMGCWDDVTGISDVDIPTEVNTVNTIMPIRPDLSEVKANV